MSRTRTANGSSKVITRDRIWSVVSRTEVGDGREMLSLRDVDRGEQLTIISPPEDYEEVAQELPTLSRESLSPIAPWRRAHQIIRSVAEHQERVGSIEFGRISPEPYQRHPLRKLLRQPNSSILVADDVGLGKTIEAGICIGELMARGRARRVLLVVPPALIQQWQEEMFEKFGFEFLAIENATGLERAQTSIPEGIKPWAFRHKIITSLEYLKKREIFANALERRWDVIIVDEAHYLAESGTPRSPYLTARARLGLELRKHTDSLILLTATPHNGYRHSFRSLIALVSPTDATFEGDEEVVKRRIARCRVRRLKSQILKPGENGEPVPAFAQRERVRPIAVCNLSDAEKKLFSMVSSYCAKTASDAEGSDDADLVGFAMQIVKKRMLSSRIALTNTVEHRLAALKSKGEQEEPPTRVQIRELQQDLPLSESARERTADRILRSAIPKDSRRLNAEKRKLTAIANQLKRLAGKPDPKLTALVRELRDHIFGHPEEKAIIFTEYRDTLSAIKEALDADDELAETYTELVGGLSQKQRLARIAKFATPKIRVLLATDAASEGLNLQKHCRNIFHVELPWNPNRLEQRNGRVDRYGQTHPPRIAYLHYPDSPEDSILDKLVRCLDTMRADQISTPDILGILEGISLNERLLTVDCEDDATLDATPLLSEFDARVAEFNADLGSLCSGIEQEEELAYGSDSMIIPERVSAGGSSPDDFDAEDIVLAVLGDRARPGAIRHTYSVDVPLCLRSAGVADRHVCVTMRRSVAVAYPARDVDFVSRLHPLFKAIVDQAFDQFWGATPTRKNLAQGRFPGTSKPLVVFTFASRKNDVCEFYTAIGITVDGAAAPRDLVSEILDASGMLGDVSWSEIEGTFRDKFDERQQTAKDIARERCAERHAATSSERREIAAVLREDAARYQVDRVAEIDREEKVALYREERVGQQLLLETRDVSIFSKKRAAVDSEYKYRLDEIDRFENRDDDPEPIPLGVLFLFPEV